jgi:urease beta subunit
MKPGAYLLNETAGPIEANVGRKTGQLTVKHRGDRPIQVGSHFHFFEVNRDLVFDRSLAYGMRLNIPAGTAVRFEPGETKTVNIVALAGERVVYGHNALIQGMLDKPETESDALEKITKHGFGHSQAEGD